MPDGTTEVTVDLGNVAEALERLGKHDAFFWEIDRLVRQHQGNPAEALREIVAAGQCIFNRLDWGHR